MKGSSWIVLALVVAGIVGVITYSVMAPRGAVRQGTPTAPSRPAAGPLIVTTQPAVRTFQRLVPWIGTVESRESVHLQARETGRVEAIEAKDQSAVHAGETVMKLGGPEVESKRAQAQAGIRSLKSQLASAGKTVQRLSQDVKDQLATTDQLAAARQSREKLDGQLHQAEIALQSFDRQLVVISPTAGVFTQRRVSIGQTVAAGETVGDVIDPNRLRIDASLFPPTGAALMGKQATVRLGQGRSMIGSVSQVLPEASEMGASRIWIEGPQVDRRLNPGQTISGTVMVQVARAATAIPTSAVVYDSRERPYVFIRKKGKYLRTRVTLGLTQEGWIQVLSGLTGGDPVVSRGAYELFHRQFTRRFKVED